MHLPSAKKNITLNQTQLKTDILTHTHLHSAKTNSHLSTSTQTFPKEKLHPPIIIPPKKFKSIHTLEKFTNPHSSIWCGSVMLFELIYMSLYVLFLDLLQAFIHGHFISCNLCLQCKDGQCLKDLHPLTEWCEYIYWWDWFRMALWKGIKNRHQRRY